MKNKKIILGIISLLFLFNIMPTSIYSQYSSIGKHNLGSFIDHLDCQFGDQIDINMDLVEQYLYDFIGPSTSFDCLPPEVNINGETDDKIGFDWQPVNGAESYTGIQIGLQTVDLSLQNVSSPGIAFSDLDAQLYLFAFITNCIDGNSLAEIIIVDKDIIMPNGEQIPDYNFECNCEEDIANVQSMDDCPFFDSYFFAWANTCFANKYRFNISGTSEFGTYNEELFVIFEESDLSPMIFNMGNCDDDGYMEDGSLNNGNYNFGDGVNFQAVITNVGIHFYFLNDALTNPNVNGIICGCYEGDSVGKIDPRQGTRRSHSTEIESTFVVNPNPFGEQIDLTVPNSPSSTQVFIFDNSGKMVLQQIFSSISNTTLHLPTHNLQNGLYHLQIVQGTQSHHEKLVKLR